MKLKNKFIILVLLIISYFPTSEFIKFIYYDIYPYKDCGIIKNKFTDLVGRGRTNYNFVIEFEKRGTRLIDPTTLDYINFKQGDVVCYEYNPIREKSHNKHDITILGLIGLLLIVLFVIVILMFIFFGGLI